MPATDRCPRCAYPLTGLPGAPARAYAAFTAEERCPECALVIPAGAHCIVGGATAGIVEPGGLRSSGIVATAAVLAMGVGPICLIGTVFFLEVGGRGIPRGGYSLGSLMGFALSALPILLGLALLGWFLWRRWRPLEGAEHAGALERRALVMPGAIFLWQGEPNGQALPSGFAAGDIREVRAKRHIPLFPRKGAPQVGSIEFVTPLTLWQNNPVRTLSISNAHNTGSLLHQHTSPFTGTMWTLLPKAVGAEALGHQLEATLRTTVGTRALEARAGAASAATPEQTPDEADPAPDPNRMRIPATITAGTPGDPPICPRCSAPLPLTAVTTGLWWEPIPASFACTRCGLAAPANALIICGARHPAERTDARGRSPAPAIMLTSILCLAVGGFGIYMTLRFSKPWGLALQMAAAIGMPLAIATVAQRYRRVIQRPRARFQRGSLTWILQPEGLRIIRRGGKSAQEILVPAKRLSRVEFGTAFTAQNQLPVELESMVARGTADELGATGERALHIPLPAEATQAIVEAAVRRALGRA